MPKQASGFCPHCGEQRLLLRESPNHVLHLILTVLTLGLWAVVWLLVAMNKSGGPARCSVCGTELHQFYRAGQGRTWEALK
jgi:predicted RNA-binding Zn-ribbon protein involved in translation (DUF1610 family)